MIQFFTDRINSLFVQLVPKSGSRRNVLKLAGGTAGGQLIFILISPILTRLYTPQSFGVLATFTAILALINAVSTLRYELAIPVPEDDEESQDLLWICGVLLILSTGLTALGVVFLGNQSSILFGEPAPTPLLWLLPVGVLLSGFYRSMTFWAIRRKQFNLLVKSKITQSLFGAVANLGLATWGPVGLILGEIVRQSAGGIEIFFNSRKQFFSSLVTLKRLSQLFMRYSNFGMYSSPAGLINMAGIQLPIIILSSTFGPQLLGQLALAQKVLLVPAGLIGVSASKVFLAKAPESFREGNLEALLTRTSRKLLVYSFITAIPIAILGPLMITFSFGESWSMSGIIIVILLPVYIAQLSVSSVSTAFIAIEKNKSELIAQAFQAIFRVLPVLLAVAYGLNFIQSLIVFSAGSFVGYFSYWILLRKSVISVSSS